MELVHGSKFYFWGQFCDVAKVVIIHRKILAKFGYRLMYESY
jgi:acyl-CoA reductase-like NAD-dependent aldehyde dehydrogenase